MGNIHINKLMNVWESNNKILKPIDKKLVVDMVDQIASLFSPGNYYYFILNFETYTLDYISEGVRAVLGVDPKDFSIESFLELMHPDDIQKMHEKEKFVLDFKLNHIPKEDITKYKTVYLMRFQLKDGTYKTILHQAKALNISDDGKLFQVLSIHTDVTYLNPRIDHKISFISNERPSFYSLDTGNGFEFIESNFKTMFTKREKEVIIKLSKGNDFNEIAELLFVSPHTINTHKRNILKKSGCKNTAELITKCIQEGII